MNRQSEKLLDITRRHFFKQTGFGIGAMALSSLLDENTFAAGAIQRVQHFAPKAKRIIYLFMAGAPSTLDLFDNKPALRKYDGQPCPDEYIKGERFAFIKGVPKLLGSPFDFKKYGQSGQEMSDHSAEPGRTRGRDRHHPHDAHDSIQSRSRADFYELRSSGSGTSEYGLVADVRPWQREQGPAWIRSPDFRREQSRWRQIVLGERIPADSPPGRRVPR